MSVIIDTGRIVILSDIGAPVVVDIGSPGTDGIGVPAGGTTGQALTKVSGTDYDTEWSTPAGGGDLMAANNLSDLADAATARTNLGLGTAATTAASAYATAAQGTLADTAVQPAAIATKLDDLSAGTADAIVTASADGTLLSRAAYTIATLLAAARDRATHTGTQLAATISDFATAALSAVTWSTLTGKPATFAPSAHTHPLSDLSQSGATSNQVPQWNGSAWVPATVGGGTPGGSTGQLQYNNAGAFGGISGSSWASNQLLITAQAAATTPLAIRAAASHTAAIQEWQNSAGTTIAKTTAAGNFVGSTYTSGAYVPAFGFAGYETTGLMGYQTTCYLVSAGSIALNANTSAVTTRTGTPLKWRDGASSTQRGEIVATAAGDVEITPSGSGLVRFGTHSAIGAESITGYIEIKDSGGTTRKIPVVS